MLNEQVMRARMADVERQVRRWEQQSAYRQRTRRWRNVSWRQWAPRRSVLPNLNTN